MQRRAGHLSTLAIVATLTAIVACSDRASTAPEAALPKQGTNESGANGDSSKNKPKGDTTKTNPDSGKTNPDSGGTKPDTGGTRPDTTDSIPPDTTGPVEPDTTRDDAYIHGSVVGVDSATSPARISALRGVAVTAFRRIVRQTSGSRDSGTVVYDSVATRTTGDGGKFAFDGLRGGHYRLRAVPPAGSGYPSVNGYPVTAWSIRDLVLTAPVVIYLHKR